MHLYDARRYGLGHMDAKAGENITGRLRRQLFLVSCMELFRGIAWVLHLGRALIVSSSLSYSQVILVIVLEQHSPSIIPIEIVNVVVIQFAVRVPIRVHPF